MGGFNIDLVGMLYQTFQRLPPDSDFDRSRFGLAIEDQVVCPRKGMIWMESEEGQGIAVYFSFDE
jgi:light-regulated signal transduction histidine kinase (bacteriophytochrome)